MNIVRNLFALIVVLCALSFVAQADIEEAQRQEDEYCNNVSSGKWPDYNENFKKVCTKTLDEQKRSL